MRAVSMSAVPCVGGKPLDRRALLLRRLAQDCLKDGDVRLALDYGAECFSVKAGLVATTKLGYQMRVVVLAKRDQRAIRPLVDRANGANLTDCWDGKVTDPAGIQNGPNRLASDSHHFLPNTKHPRLLYSAIAAPTRSS